MPLTKLGVVTRKVTKPEKPKSRPKTIKQLAENAQWRLARKVVRRVVKSDE